LFLQQFLFAVQSIIQQNVDRAGYQLLRCLRAYLNVVMYSEFDVHTEVTIDKGRKAVMILSREIKVLFGYFYYAYTYSLYTRNMRF
jgi:hypothetical protein